jgi:putative intracellular protease/amidase
MPRRGVRILPAHQATRMTIFSASEEKWVENDILHAKMYFNMPYALKTAGGEVINGSVDFEPHVIADRELITGQNPRFDHPIAAKLIEALAHREGSGAV